MSEARYTDATRSLIEATVDGAPLIIPADPENRHYAALLEAGVAIAEPAFPAVTADDVRAEASRRLQAMFGARDAGDLAVKISNAQRESSRLYAVRLGIPGISEGRQWTDQEAARARDLYAADQAVEAIRAASNALEAAPPADFDADRHWPAVAAAPRVTWAQVMKALALHGVLATPDVLDAIQAGHVTERLQLEIFGRGGTVPWPSDAVDRASPLLGLVAAGLGLSEADVAAVWAVAASVSAEAA